MANMKKSRKHFSRCNLQKLPRRLFVRQQKEYRESALKPSRYASGTDMDGLEEDVRMAEAEPLLANEGHDTIDSSDASFDDATDDVKSKGLSNLALRKRFVLTSILL